MRYHLTDLDIFNVTPPGTRPWDPFGGGSGGVLGLEDDLVKSQPASELAGAALLCEKTPLQLPS